MKRARADLRTPDMFTGKTKLEEVEDMVHEEQASQIRRGDPTAIADNARKSAVRWLGLDAFHEGDDVNLALHEDGHGVLVLVRTKGDQAYASAQVKLSRAQVQKLKKLGEEIP
jgi:hypothetical protein